MIMGEVDEPVGEAIPLVRPTAETNLWKRWHRKLIGAFSVYAAIIAPVPSDCPENFIFTAPAYAEVMDTPHPNDYFLVTSSANVKRGNMDRDDLVDSLAQQRHGILCLQEATESLVSDIEDQSSLTTIITGWTLKLPAKDHYGNVILTDLPVKSFVVHPLNPNETDQEPRNVIIAVLDHNGHDLVVAATHLTNGIFNDEIRTQEATTLRGFLASPFYSGKNLRICGDLNSDQGDEAYKILAEGMQDSALSIAGAGDRATLPGPRRRVDYVLTQATTPVQYQLAGGNNSDHCQVIYIEDFETAVQ